MDVDGTVVHTSGPGRRRPLALIVVAGAVVLAGCSASGAAEPSASSSAPAPTGRPLATGTISSTGSASFVVQDPRTGQTTTVSWSATTKFTSTVAATVSDVVVGECAQVIGLAGSSSAPASARSVSLSPASSAGCTRPSFGRGGGAGGFGGGGFAGGFSALAFAFGRVTAVASQSLTVQGTSSGGSSSTSTFDLTSSTTITKLETASASAATTGECATAYGSSPSSGTVSATMVAFRPAGPNGCFGGAGGGGFSGTAPPD